MAGGFYAEPKEMKRDRRLSGKATGKEKFTEVKERLSRPFFEKIRE